MKPSDRELVSADVLSTPFVAIPSHLFEEFPRLGISSSDMFVLLQILSLQQIHRLDFLTPKELAERCAMSVPELTHAWERLVNQGLLSIGDRLDAEGTLSNYFDLKPLWMRLRGKNPEETPVREWRRDAITLFEEEFGRPLSGFECDQIRQWMEEDAHPEWMIVEALREAVLANKYSLRYIDRVLFDWHRNRIRTRAELEAYRSNFRDRTKGKEEAAASVEKGSRQTNASSTKKKVPRDERYNAFYELFPDT